MKCAVILIFFCFWNFPIIHSKILPIKYENSEIFLCLKNLIKQWNEIELATHDIYIYNLVEENLDFVKFIPSENPLKIYNSFSKVDEPLRPASLRIIISDHQLVRISNKHFWGNQILKFTKQDSVQVPRNSTFWEISSKYIFLPNSPLSTAKFIKFSEHFWKHGILNFVAITRDFLTEDTKILSHNPFFNQTQIYDKNQKFDKIFQDKLRDLNGHEYRLLFLSQPDTFRYHNGTFSGINSFVLDTITKKQNATFRVTNKFDMFSENFSAANFLKAYDSNEYDLHFSTIVGKRSNTTEPINSYFPLDFCIAVPEKFTEKSFQYFLVSPFSLEIWLLILGSVLCSVLIWGFIYYKKLSRSPDSPSKFFFAIVGYFFGQDSPFQRLCLLQKFLIGIFLFGFFFLSNLYTSQLVSLQGESKIIRQISNLDDIKTHNLTVRTGERVYNSFNNSEKFCKIMKNFINESHGHNAHKAVENREGLSAKCSVLEAMFSMKELFQYAADQYYMLDEKFHNNFEYYFYNRLNPYRYKLQQYIDMIFESGLTHYYRVTQELTKPKIKRSEDQGNLIGFDDLFLTFMFYLAGNLLAFFVFLIEIIWAKISKLISQRRNRNEFFQRNP
jgi:hypothetical protein